VFRAGSQRIGRFGLVGAAGFLVDAGALAALHHGAGLDPLVSRMISLSCSTLTTWRLNRALTFGSSGASQAAEGARYGVVAGLAAGVNYAAYAIALLLVPGLPPAAALIAGAATAMGLSYFGYSRFVFGGAELAVLASPRSQSR